MSFVQDIASIRAALSQPETEDSWATIAKSITKLEDICKVSSSDASSEIVPSIRALSRPLISAMSSERTRLSGIAINFLGVLASVLGRPFEPLIPLFLPPLLALCARPNKVFVTRARTCILTIVETTQLPSVLPYLLQSLQDKSSSLRLIAMESVLACLNCFNPPDIEKEARAQDVENAIRATARDASADVRKVSRKVFEAYKLLLPGRVESFTAPLTPTMKKYLDVPTRAIIPVPRDMPKRSQTSQGLNSTRPHSYHKGNNPSLTSASTPTTFSNDNPRARRVVSHVKVASTGAIPPESLCASGSGLRCGTANELASRIEVNVPPLETSHLHASQRVFSASLPSRPVRQRTISAPSNPSTAIVLAKHPESTNVQTDIARRQPSVLSFKALTRTPLSVPSVESAPVRGETDGGDALLNSARRVPIPSTPEDNVDPTTKRTKLMPHIETSDSAKPPRSYVSKTKVTSDSKVMSKKPKNIAKSISVPEKPSTRPISSTGTIRPFRAITENSGNEKPGGIKNSAESQSSQQTRRIVEKRSGTKPVWGRHVPSRVDSTKPSHRTRSNNPASQAVSVLPKSEATQESTATFPEQLVSPRELGHTVSGKVGPFELHEKTGIDNQDMSVPNYSETAKGAVEIDVDTDGILAHTSPSETNEGDRDSLVVTPRCETLEPASLPMHTPISSLLSSIQSGFISSPSSPLSPPQSYLSFPSAAESSTVFGLRPIKALSVDEGSHD